MLFEFPQTLSRYQPIAEIGHGGMAEVILAQMRVGRGVKKLAVLKRIWPDLAAEPEFISMFLREAHIGARMNHPNIVQTYEVLEDTERPAIAMEYLEGQPLTRVMNRMVKSGGLTMPLRLRILAQVLTALDYAHELTDYDGSRQGVVHRDVNPQNVIVTYDGQIKLVDFGLAKSVSAAYQTRTGGRGGKLSYMSPEQARGGLVDRRADIFSVGVMLWEMTSGRRLWQGMGEESIIRHLSSRVPVRPLPSNPNLPYGLDRVCARALSIDPDRRYETAAEFAYELDRLVPGSDDSHGRHLGKIVSLAFAGERAARRSMIEQHVRAHADTFDDQDIPLGSPTGGGRRAAAGAGPPRGTSGRARAVPHTPTRLPPPSRSPRGAFRRQSPVPIWTEGDDEGEGSSSGETLTLDAQSIISVEPLSGLVDRDDSEALRKTMIYVPRASISRFRWIAMGFGAALALMIGAGVVSFALTRLGTERAFTAPRVSPRERAQIAEPSIAPVSPSPSPSPSSAPSLPAGARQAPTGTPTLMSVVTRDTGERVPARRPAPNSAVPLAAAPRAAAARRRMTEEESAPPLLPRGARAGDDVLPPSEAASGTNPLSLSGSSMAVAATDGVSPLIPSSAATEGAAPLAVPPPRDRPPRAQRPIDTSDPFSSRP